MNPDSNWVLVGLGGPVKGREFVFIADEVRIGRTSENDIVVPDKSVSRHHASFFVQGATFWVQDMNSKNGTYINQQKISKIELHKNDIVRIGEAKFKVSKDEAVAVAPSALLVKLQDPKFRRIAIYAVVGLVLIGVIIPTMKGSKNPTPTKAVATQDPVATPTEEIDPSMKPIEATDQQVSDWVSQADAVLQYEDYNASLQLLKKVVSARPQDLKAKSKLKQVEGRLKSRLSLYSENGAREFEKLNYDKAIMEWRIVLALSKGFDEDTYKRTGEKIREAEEKLKQKKP